MSTPSRPGSSRPATSLRRWAGYLALVIVFAVACVLLSRWQFARLDAVRAQIATIDANYSAPAVPIAALLQPDAPLAPENQWRSVVVTGTFDIQHEVLVRNRTHEGVTGFDIITPLRDSRGISFFIDRGWIPTADDGRSPAVVPPATASPVTVIARLRPSEPVLQGQSDTSNLISSIHVVELARDWNIPAYTGAYGLLAEQTPSGANGVLASRPNISEGNHLSYALQWIAFAVLGFIALWWAVRHERRARSQQDKPVSQRPRKRGVSDSDIEDALLDGNSRV